MHTSLSRLNSFMTGYVACAEQYIPQWCSNTKVSFGVIVMDVMMGRPVALLFILDNPESSSPANVICETA